MSTSSKVLKAGAAVAALAVVGGIAWKAYTVVTAGKATAAASSDAATPVSTESTSAGAAAGSSKPAAASAAPAPAGPQRTFIMLKPDALQRGKVGALIAKIEERGFKLCALKLLTPSVELVVRRGAGWCWGCGRVCRHRRCRRATGAQCVLWYAVVGCNGQVHTLVGCLRSKKGLSLSSVLCLYFNSDSWYRACLQLVCDANALTPLVSVFILCGCCGCRAGVCVVADATLRARPERAVLPADAEVHDRLAGRRHGVGGQQRRRDAATPHGWCHQAH